MIGLFKKRVPPVTPVIDLENLSCDDLRIGQALPTDSPYRPFFTDNKDGSRTYRNSDCGLEIGTRKGLVDSLFISLDSFTGRFTLDGQPVHLTKNSTESEVSKLLGEPWWKEVDAAAEVVDFYEFADGHFEMQFEYPPLSNLAFITILREGTLADPEQREAYGVSKPWPPIPDDQ
jgi:hypothetical protein